ncbi:unnamed protein product [Durusdinium trenchii]|uniref:Uncharacterized protein n=1 Tax=Durusdinium trenchii TaxID=1381693 RepID=A0ABP0JSQ0_9DINO
MGFVPTQVEGKKKQSGSKQKKNKKKKNQKKNGKDQKKSQKKENQKKDKCGKKEEDKKSPPTPDEPKPVHDAPHTPVKKAKAAKAKAKGSPKAKAKSSPKAKAKGSPKPKSVMKAVLEKPSTAKLPKKPAEEEKVDKAEAKAKSKNKKKRKAEAEKKKKEEAAEKKKKEEAAEKKKKEEEDTVQKKPGEKEEPEEPEEEACGFEDDPSVDPGATETRDRCKMQKFNKMYQAGQLLPWIKEEWEKTLTMKSGKRERQSLIVNSLFDRSEAGRLVLNANKAVFQSMKESFEEKTNKQSTKSLSKRLFMGRFNLTEADLLAGVAEGEFQEIQTDHGPRYLWMEEAQTCKQGDKTALGWIQQKEGDQKQMAKMNKMIEAMSAGHWSQGFALPTTSGSSSSAAPPLAIQDMDAPLSPQQWKMAQTQLIQAKDAMSKLEKDGLKHLQVIGDNRADPVFEVLAEISHAYRFKELENGQELTLSKHNALMAECGKKAESLDDILAGIKGQLNARANRAKK